MLAVEAMGVAQSRIPWQRPAFFWTGIILIVTGVCVRWYAIRVLGASFTRDVAVRAHQVVVDRPDHGQLGKPGAPPGLRPRWAPVSSAGRGASVGRLSGGAVRRVHAPDTSIRQNTRV